MSRPSKLPPALAKAKEAYGSLEHEIDDVLHTMERWPEVRDHVLDWASSMTTTNIGWDEYGLARAITDRWHQKQRQSSRQ